MELIKKRREDVYALFRIVIGLLFTCHGAQKLFGLFASGESAHMPAFGSWPGWWSGAIEFFGGAAVLLGVFTHVAALICSGSMAYAYFVVHQPLGLWPIENSGESAAIYCWAFLLIAFFGPGKYALSTLLQRSKQREEQPIA